MSVERLGTPQRLTAAETRGLDVAILPGEALEPAGCPRSRALGHSPEWLRTIGSNLFPNLAQVAQFRTAAGEVGILPCFADSNAAGEKVGVTIGIPPHKHIALADILTDEAFLENAGVDPLFSSLSAAFHWDRALFCRVPERSFLLHGMKGSSLRRSIFSDGRSAFCDVSHAESLASLSKENLRNVERLRRRTERDYGSAAIIRLARGHEVDAAFDRFVAIESGGWKGAGGTGLSVDREGYDFFRNVTRAFWMDDRARIDILTIGDRDAATQLAVRVGATWYLLKIGYVDAFKDVGPGAILLKSFLEEMRDDPTVQEVNLSTDPPWAARWHFQSEPTYSIEIFNRTIRGQYLYTKRRLRSSAKLVGSTLLSGKKGADE